MNIYAKGRAGQYEAKAEYDNGTIIIKKGTKIAPIITNRKLPANVLELRENREVVSEENILLEDIIVTTPSMAATFITGNISNGYRVWKTEEGKKLGDIISKEKK